MNKFLIFGDSFADEHSPPYPSSDENREWQKKHSYRWPIKIKEKFENQYEYYNLALDGSSPYSALKKMHKFKITKGDIILFFLSDFDRIDFIAPLEIKSHLSNIFYSTESEKSELFEDPGFNKHEKLKAFYLLHEPELDFFYKTLHNILSHEMLEKLILSYLKNLSYEKNCRIILFRKNPSDLTEDYKLKNTKYYYEFDKILSLVSDYEWSNLSSQEYDYMIKDERVNHLSPENHEIMFDSICKILDNDFDNVLNFKTKILNEDFIKNIVYRGLNDRKFIYE